MSSVPTSQARDAVKAYSPPWLAEGNAELFMYTIGLMHDALREKANQATKIGMVGQGDPSQIPWLAKDRVLVQGPAESNASFLIRLTNARNTWKRAGSRVAVLEELQAYLQNLQPGVASVLPEMTIVGGNYPSIATWDTIYQGTTLGAPPSHQFNFPSNFNWDGKSQPWRNWLILFMSLVPTGLSGSSAATGSSHPGSFIGQNVNGVWVPGGGSGPTVGNGFIGLTGLTGLTATQEGQWITTSGSGNAGNNGTFQIATVSSPTACTIANPNAVASDVGPIAWSISSYPYIAPGPCYGTPGYVYGQGQNAIPPITLGKNIGGVWQSSGSAVTNQSSLSWGLNCSPLVIESIRGLLKTWKSAGTYYPNIVIAFDGGTGAPGSAYSANSAAGSGNPDGTFGSVGQNVNGVWVPTRKITSAYDAYCQGTGIAVQCSQENYT